MRNHFKRKWRPIRNEFKKDIESIMDKATAMAILKTYIAGKHRSHIHKIWKLLGMNYKDAYNDYCSELMGKMLCGKDELLHTMYFINTEFYHRWIGKIPESIALGDAYAVARRYL